MITNQKKKSPERPRKKAPKPKIKKKSKSIVKTEVVERSDKPKSDAGIMNTNYRNKKLKKREKLKLFLHINVPVSDIK
jgi:hypothetical protein